MNAPDDTPDFLKDIRKEAAEYSAAAEVINAAQHSMFTTLQAELENIRRLPADEIVDRWLPRALLLKKSEAKEFIAEVSRLTGRGKQALNADLKDAREVEKTTRATARARQNARGRIFTEYQPAALTHHAREIEEAISADAAPGEYVDFGGTLSRVAYQQLPFTHEIDDEEGDAPSVPQIAPLGEVDVLEKAEAVYALCTYGKNDTPHAIAIPERIINIILRKSEHNAPRITGLVTHPLVFSDGEIFSSRGLHKSGLFLACEQVEDLRPYSRKEAVAAISRLRAEFLDGFEFAEPIDSAVALAGLLTAVERRVMDVAPGLEIIAAVQSSGKTTLARRLHVILTGSDMPVLTFPRNDEAEVRKTVLAMLLRNPSMCCFDNIPDGTRFNSATISAVMTSQSFQQRILGQSRDVACPTNVFFCITGNNIQLGADETSRWMTTRLAPQTAHPEARRFKHADVVGHALRMRDAVLRDVVGIVAGYVKSKERIEPKSRFNKWDALVRQPLIWAGELDVAEVFATNSRNSEHVLAYEALLLELCNIFSKDKLSDAEREKLEPNTLTSKFTSPDVVNALTGDASSPLRLALENLRVRDVESTRAIGAALKTNTGRIAEIATDDDYGLLNVTKNLCLRHEVQRPLNLFYVVEVPRNDADDDDF